MVNRQFKDINMQPDGEDNVSDWLSLRRLIFSNTSNQIRFDLMRRNRTGVLVNIQRPWICAACSSFPFSHFAAKSTRVVSGCFLLRICRSMLCIRVNRSVSSAHFRRPFSSFSLDLPRPVFLISLLVLILYVRQSIFTSTVTSIHCFLIRFSQFWTFFFPFTF
jgi:hypothetical protein